MAINLDAALGISAKTLVLRAKRAEVLANNIANADTPGFKARDMDFASALKEAKQGTPSAALGATNSMHLPGNSAALNFNMKYTQDSSPSLDGNTVDNQAEISKFTENALRYQASLTFLGGSVRGLMTAIRGD